ncbi:uncharacterized protein LOC132631718 [Lycium barbarum]|uniref:uncharacterized protein LOC132631718 n=1 Tax=Lycium barbarum TaxID=112863 RepID=UPI00293EBE53|nr:uncharacterized protein LOC132631718 [Lycium barbarum]
MPALHKPIPSKLQPFLPSQSLVQKKETLQAGMSKVISKQVEPSSKAKPVMQKQAVPSSHSQDLGTSIYKSRCKFEYFEQVDKFIIGLIGLFGKTFYYKLILLAIELCK